MFFSPPLPALLLLEERNVWWCVSVMVYEPLDVRLFAKHGLYFGDVHRKARSLKRLVIRLAILHRENPCECSACFDSVTSAAQLSQDLVKFIEYSMNTTHRPFYNYTSRQQKALKVCKHRLWRLMERAYRSSLRHNYTTETFLRDLKLPV